MKVWTVHLHAHSAPVLLREGFSWGALLFGPLWLLAHRAWIPGILLLCAWIAAGFAPPPLRLVAMLALAWLAGLCGRDLLRWSLDRRGYLLADVLAAASQDAALARLLDRRPDLATEALA